MFYAIKATEIEPGKWEGSCRDIPECLYEANSKEEALELAKSMVPGTLELFYRRKRKVIPMPSPAEEGEEPIYIPARVQAKIALWNYLVSNRYRLSDISKLLDISPAQTQRLVDLSKDGASMEAIEDVLYKLGLYFEVRAVAQPKAA